MSEPPAGTSSGAAETGEEAFVVANDTRDGRRLRRCIPLIHLERAAENDPVRAREHVTGAAREGVLHLGLRFEDSELAPGRMQILITEQVAAPEACTVEDETFR